MTPAEVFAARAPFALVHGKCEHVLPTIVPPPELRGRVHVITDPPYSEAVHARAKTSRKRKPGAELLDGNGRKTKAAKTRRMDLGFEPLPMWLLWFVAKEAARLAGRWVLVFSDELLAPKWREALEHEGLEYIRTGVWTRTGGAPQFSGDRPAVGAELVTIAHPRGRKWWNGGGHPARWDHPIVANRSRHRGDRVHSTQKPLKLMLDIIGDFTAPGDIVIDPFAGSGSTGVACLRLGRRFIGIEMSAADATTATEALEAELASSSIQARRLGQSALFAKPGVSYETAEAPR